MPGPAATPSVGLRAARLLLRFAPMDSDVAIVLGLTAGVIGLVGFFIWLARRQQRTIRARLEEMAAHLGLELRDTKQRLNWLPPELAGTRHGRRLRIYCFKTGSGKSQQFWCAIGADLRNPAGHTLELAREGWLARVGKTLGLQDLTVGDDTFDRRFVVRAGDPSVLTALLPEWRTRLLEVFADRDVNGRFELKGHQLTYVESGFFTSRARATRFPILADLTLELADALEALGSIQPPVDAGRAR